jgi:hypothetical protein
VSQGRVPLSQPNRQLLALSIDPSIVAVRHFEISGTLVARFTVATSAQISWV